MKRVMAAVLLAACAALPMRVMAGDLQSPVGLWQTIDDKTGKPKSLVRISETNGELRGRVEQILPLPGNNVNARCDKCEGDKKGQPVTGMDILWGLRQHGDDWSGGTILDPKKGETYNCKLHVAEDGKTLRVRGFMGISLLGRSQTWNRVE